jgi:hypothetical protein
MPYVPNSQLEFTWSVYDHQGHYIGKVKTTRKSEGAAKLKAREMWGPNTYTVHLIA